MCLCPQPSPGNSARHTRYKIDNCVLVCVFRTYTTHIPITRQGERERTFEQQVQLYGEGRTAHGTAGQIRGSTPSSAPTASETHSSPCQVAGAWSCSSSPGRWSCAGTTVISARAMGFQNGSISNADREAAPRAERKRKQLPQPLTLVLEVLVSVFCFCASKR